MKITEYEKSETKYTNRFLTKNIKKAFLLAESLNTDTLKEGRAWRVGKVIADRVIIEIDSHDLSNLLSVYLFYSRIFGNFHVVKTLHGYHMVQEQISKEIELDRIKVLIPDLKDSEKREYRKTLLDMLESLKNEKVSDEKIGTPERLDRLRKALIDWGLDKHHGDIDTLHAATGIMRGKYVLRISKKTENDKMEVII